MKRNMGNLDRAVRSVIVAPVLIVLGATVFGGALSVVAFVLAGVMLATSAVGFCPLYALLGISTCPRTSGTGNARLASQH